MEEYALRMFLQRPSYLIETYLIYIIEKVTMSVLFGIRYRCTQILGGECTTRTTKAVKYY